MPEKPRAVQFWLERICEYSSRAALHVDGFDRADFLQDSKSIDAVCWCISCIGEACGKLLELDHPFDLAVKDEFLSAYNARNRYIHAYYSLDELQIWDTVRVAVPQIGDLAQKLLGED